ncbi:SDR family NAD(P)-dependent oxidoreductase [Cryobacterium arcticum]|uniref:3-hydroxy-2-methylbutyryl-CoA dehydrogenase n=1 Tax=Cryobacterium arcticum TaxID=670052 RepID=A0A1B1BG01_9MICO|nr:SDR family NAD(P)-dependent oxidoreductase [Cryobacterium arcticum]ANP71509.1 3-hydroxy-2-methylbutyryl-CoA dehydrogenase [Cryobacterium arcticum]
MRIDGCSALVTGAASGLGLATARALLEAGAHVVLFDLAGSAGEDRAAELNARARSAPRSAGDRASADAAHSHAGMDHHAGGTAIFHPGDVTSEADVAAAVAEAGTHGPLRIVVNCAGIAPAARAVGRQGAMPLGDFERVLRVNLLGTFNVVRLAAVAMQAVDPLDPGAVGPADGIDGGTPERGVIVNTASVAAFDGQIGQAAYAASKGGVAAMTLPLAREFARSLIRVMTIAPGLFDTPLLQGLPAEARASLGAQVPHPARLGNPAEYAALVRHIVENPMLNGETIRLDGGIRMAPQ